MLHKWETNVKTPVWMEPSTGPWQGKATLQRTLVPLCDFIVYYDGVVYRLVSPSNTWFALWMLVGSSGGVLEGTVTHLVGLAGGWNVSSKWLSVWRTCRLGRNVLGAQTWWSHLSRWPSSRCKFSYHLVPKCTLNAFSLFSIYPGQHG